MLLLLSFSPVEFDDVVPIEPPLFEDVGVELELPKVLLLDMLSLISG